MTGNLVNILCASCLFLFTYSPVSLACDKANDAYNRLLFSIAIDEFEKCIKSGKEIQSLEKLANSYKILGNAKQALTTYYRIEDKENMSIAAKLEFAYLLRAQENKEAALSWVESCLKVHSGHPQLLNMKDVFAKETIFEENDTYRLETAPFNSPESDYCPSYFNNTLVFSSTRIQTKQIDGYTSQNYSRLYYYDQNRQKVLPYAAEIIGAYNIGSTTFSTDGKEMYFTRNRDKLNANNMASFVIWKSLLQGGKWSAPVPAFVQNEKFNFVHPNLSQNGKMLIFSTDMDALNGHDLYICERTSKSGNWSSPKKLPEYINSTQDEVFPVFLSDSVIVFSQESPAGLGGLDMYTSRFVNGLWTYPVNLGKPFNSPYDDYGILSDDEFKQGYFTSTRGNDSGIDNIYSFVKNPPRFFEVTIEIKDSISGLPIPGVSVVYVQDDSPGIFYVTDSPGQIRLTADKSRKSGVVIAYKGVLLKTLNLQNLQPDEDGELRIPLSFNSQDFIISGTTVNREGKVVPEVELSFIDESISKAKKVTSDQVGEYEFSAKQNTSYTVTAQKDGYFAPVSKINTTDFDRSKSLKVDVDLTIDKAEKQKVFRLNNIYYDYNHWNIRQDASAELDNLVSFLEQNPTITITLGSHTDSRGKDDYNLLLSQKRAESVLRYLMNNGIDLSRVKAKGYGETKLINQCSNGVSCTEAEHQDNRRTEITIDSGSQN
jgi:outer membrane protein OmpA-like peptidoglycan-associated protein/tetratricopeptide (TPR) repeat protein